MLPISTLLCILAVLAGAKAAPTSAVSGSACPASTPRTMRLVSASSASASASSASASSEPTGAITAIGDNLASDCPAPMTITVTMDPAAASSSVVAVPISSAAAVLTSASAVASVAPASSSVSASPSASAAVSSAISVNISSDTASVATSSLADDSTTTVTPSATSTASAPSATLTASAPLATASTSIIANSTGAETAVTGSLASLMSAQNKRYFGSAVQASDLEIAELTPILEAQFDSLTPGNEMKWSSIQPTQGVFNWVGADAIVAEAKKMGAKVRGHNFCWNSQTPNWVTSITNATELEEVLEAHITAVMTRYADDMSYFDVINEPLDGTGAYQSSVWFNVLGESYIAKALTFARAAAPSVKLCINDYSIEDVNAKSGSLLKIAEGLLADKVPLDCIGFESHFIGGTFPGDIAASMKQFTDIGLEVALTELDIRIPVPSTTGSGSAADLATQATDYSHAIGACLGNDLCPGVTVWGFADAVSWIPAFFSGQGDACLYDEDYKPKAAYTAVVSALQAGSTAT